MSQMEEYIMGLSSGQLIKFITTDKSLHSAKELKFAMEEAKKRGLLNEDNQVVSKNHLEEAAFDEEADFYRIDNKSTAEYIKENYGGAKVDTEQMDRNNIFAGRTMMENDLDVTTLLMWFACFVPLISGVVVSNIFIPNGIEIPAFILVTLLDAIVCLTDYFLLKKHRYKMGNLWLAAIALAPVYMVMRKKVLREKNFYHVIWILLFCILIFFMPK